MPGTKVYLIDGTRQSQEYPLYGRPHEQVDITSPANITAPSRSGLAFFGGRVVSMGNRSIERYLSACVVAERDYFLCPAFFYRCPGQPLRSPRGSHAGLVERIRVFATHSAPHAACTQLKFKSNFFAPNLAKGRIPPAKRRSRIRLTAPQG